MSDVLRASSRMIQEDQHDLIDEEYEGYISVLTFRINQFIIAAVATPNNSSSEQYTV